ncbi:hypothetical protein R3P38DRAFT_2366779, partial [Favolaschia claudopus]
PPPKCSQSKCGALPTPGYSTCQKCRDSSNKRTRAKRARAKEAAEAGQAQKRARIEEAPNDSEDGSDAEGANSGDSNNAFPNFDNQQELFLALRNKFKSSNQVRFRGSFEASEDPLITDKERVQMFILEVWKVTGYRFRVKENISSTTGHRTRLWCCQDKNRKQKARPSAREGAKHRDTLGMDRFDCKSVPRVSSLDGNPGMRRISISLIHLDAHVPYYDVALP